MDDIKETIRDMVSPTNLEFADPIDIVKLGPEAVLATIELFRNPITKYGNLNTITLACALVGYAKGGDKRAYAFLEQILNGQVPLVQGAEKNAILGLIQEFFNNNKK